MSKRVEGRGNGAKAARKVSRNGGTARAARPPSEPNQAFLLAFADALRHILEEERRRLA